MWPEAGSSKYLPYFRARSKLLTTVLKRESGQPMILRVLSPQPLRAKKPLLAISRTTVGRSRFLIQWNWMFWRVVRRMEGMPSGLVVYLREISSITFQRCASKTPPPGMVMRIMYIQSFSLPVLARLYSR
jgi:hypothetical protein